MPALLRFDMNSGNWVEIENPREMATAISAVLTRSAAEIEADRQSLVDEAGRFRSYILCAR
jgi:hypothetical protein